MQNIDDLYNKFEIPAKQRIQNRKSIGLIIPDSEYDITEDLKFLKLDKKEVVCLYPKYEKNPAGFMASEAKALGIELLIQLGNYTISPKLPILIPNTEPSDSLKAMIVKAIGGNFVNLHHHDEYSIRDGLGTNKQLITKLKKNKRNFCCVTNHGSIAGWIQQYDNCKKEDIKSIFGCELYQNEYRGDDPEEKKQNRSASHLTTIAKTQEGFDNLIKIHNDAQLNGYYYSPRTTMDVLKKFGRGLISTSSCILGNISRALREDKIDDAKKWIESYKDAFDEFYIELPMVEWDVQVETNRKLIKLSKELNIPTIVSLDSHYVEKADSETHDILMLIRDRKTILDITGSKEDPWQFECRNLYYRMENELRDLWENGFEKKDKETGEIKKIHFKDDIFTEEVLNNSINTTREIALKCEHMKLDSSLKLPKLYKDGPKVLKEKAWEGLRKKKLDNDSVYKERLEFELKVISDLGYADYFLTLDKILDATIKEHGEFSIGHGRGCFHPNSKVWTSNGLPKYIGDIQTGEKVISHDGSIQTVEEVYSYDCDEDLLEIEMEDGRIIRCTKDHEILIDFNGIQKWIKAEDLREEDDIVEV